jgi:hypothetical protein
MLTLAKPPSPWLLPVLLFLLALELSVLVGKQFYCRTLSEAFRRLSARKYEVIIGIKGVSSSPMLSSAPLHRSIAYCVLPCSTWRSYLCALVRVWIKTYPTKLITQLVISSPDDASKGC